MNILDIAKQRFSVRNYLTKEISQETLETILEAAHVAPTAANMQPVKLLVVKSDEAKEIKKSNHLDRDNNHGFSLF